MDEEKKKPEEQMSSEEMFNSWSAQLMEGVEEQPVSSKTSMENKIQYDDSSKNDGMSGKAQSFNSSDIQINNSEKNNLNNDVTKKEITQEDFSNGFNPNMQHEQHMQHEQQNVSNEIPQPSQMMENGQMGNNIDNVTINRDSRNDTGESNSPVIGMIFLVIILFGIGYFIYDSITTSKLKEEEEIHNVVDTSKKEDNKKNDKNDKNKEDVTNNHNEDNENTGNSGDIVNEFGTAQDGNDKHSQELRRLCSLTNDNGDYYVEMTGDMNDFNYVIENARYCVKHSCLYRQDNYVYSRNCSSGLETKVTIEEAKISRTIEVACIEFNNTGSYSNPDWGITCSNGHCRASYNGRNFDQNCSKFK